MTYQHIYKECSWAVELKRIGESNFIDAFHLKLGEGQERFVSNPVRSLAQAYVYYYQCTPFGVYDGDVMVGYVMVIYDYDIPEYDIWHMMIDRAYQGRGFGRAAMEKAIAYIRTKPFGSSDRVALTCHRDNEPARKLYQSLGYAPTVESDGEEIELAMTL